MWALVVSTPLHPFRVQVRDREVEAIDMPRSVSLQGKHDLEGLSKMVLSHSSGLVRRLCCDLAAMIGEAAFEV